MNLKKFRWSKVYESSEEELLAYLQSRNLEAQRITAEALDETSERSSTQQCTIWCAEGSLVLRTEQTKISIQPGDAVSIPANSSYDFIAGITGYVYYITS